MFKKKLAISITMWFTVLTVAAQCRASQAVQKAMTVEVEKVVTVEAKREAEKAVTVEVTAKPATTPPASTTQAVTTTNETMTEANEGTQKAMLTYQSMEFQDGTTLRYAVLTPENFDTTQTYPILLAFPPGGQTQDLVQWALDSYWADQAIKRGWIVLSPVAPGGQLFFQGSETLIPQFLERTSEMYRPEGGKYHIAGVSNGGISAFRVALQNPDKTQSLLVLPGFPRTPEEFQKLETLKDIPVAMFVGEQDSSWVATMQATEEELSRLGGNVSLEIVPGEPHVIRSLVGGEALFDLLESFR